MILFITFSLLHSFYCVIIVSFKTWKNLIKILLFFYKCFFAKRFEISSYSYSFTGIKKFLTGIKESFKFISFLYVDSL